MRRATSRPSRRSTEGKRGAVQTLGFPFMVAAARDGVSQLLGARTGRDGRKA